MLPDGTILNPTTVEQLREGIPEMLFSSALRARLLLFSSAPSRRQSAVVFVPGSKGMRLKLGEEEGSGGGGGFGIGAEQNDSQSGSNGCEDRMRRVRPGGSSSGCRSSSSGSGRTAQGCVAGVGERDFGLMDCLKSCLLECAKSAAGEGGGGGLGQLRGRDIIATIVPTGGGTLFPGFLSRFKEEVRMITDGNTLFVRVFGLVC